MKTKVLKNVYSVDYTEKSKDGTRDNFTNRVVVDIVNLSGDYKDKDGNDQSFSSDKIRISNIKLDFLSGDVKHKVINGKDGKAYSMPDKSDLFIGINQFKDLLYAVSVQNVEDLYDELDFDNN